jgi:methionyl aminopeptidase
MRSGSKKEFASNMLVSLKGQEWLEKQRVAGRVAAGAISLLENEVKNGTTKSLLELDALAETYIRDNGCTPTFLHYKGFPNSVCISINRQLVHGVCTEYRLQEGDLISVDLGATYQGTIGDTAITLIYGAPKSDKHVQLVMATEEALMQGIAAIQVGKRLGCIGEAIYKCARKYGLSVVVNYGGHGIDTAADGTGIPHSAPFIANKAEINEGIRIREGLVIAIEPLFVLGSSNRTYTLDDGWTVVCDDLSSHYEHTVFVHKNHVEIITAREEK